MTHNVEVDFSIMGDKIDLTSSKLVGNVSHFQFCDKLVSFIFYKILLLIY